MILEITQYQRMLLWQLLSAKQGTPVELVLIADVIERIRFNEKEIREFGEVLPDGRLAFRIDDLMAAADIREFQLSDSEKNAVAGALRTTGTMNAAMVQALRPILDTLGVFR